jgi:hypothetical protein
MPHGKGQNQQIFKKLKSSIVRKIRPLVNGSFISIEASNTNSLHLNIITTSQEPIDNQIIPKLIAKQDIEIDYFQEDNIQDDIRHITSYALKGQSIPSPDSYQGNLYNVGGDMTTISKFLKTERMYQKSNIVCVKALSIQLEKLDFKIHPEALYKTNSFMKIKDDFLYLARQADKFNMCYSKRHGLLTTKEFRNKYNALMSSCNKEYKAMIRQESKLIIKNEAKKNFGNWQDI